MAYDIHLDRRAREPAAVIRGHLAEAGIPAFLGSAFTEVLEVLEHQGVRPSGPPFARYLLLNDGFAVAAGFPTTAPVAPEGHVEPDVLPGGDVASTVFEGPYEQIAPVYAAMEAWLASHGYEVAGDPWEVYLDGPEVGDPRTVVCFPCALETWRGREALV